MVKASLLLLAQLAQLGQLTNGLTTVAFIADIHLGEGCATPLLPDSPNCSNWVDLNRSINYITNNISGKKNLSLVLVGGDVTASGDATQYRVVRGMLDALPVSYFPIMGNHDIWPYNESYDAPDASYGDVAFGATFAHMLSRTGAYANTTVYNPERKCNSTFQSFELDLGAMAAAGQLSPTPALGAGATAAADDLQGVLVLAPDFNTRRKALPGYKGALGEADLHNFTGGVFPWLKGRLAAARETPPTNIVLMIHQPFRCRAGVPDSAFCFSGHDKDAVRGLLAAHYPLSTYWGGLFGHQHRWFNGTAFDEAEWSDFRQWENSAVKGDVSDSAMSSSITTLDFDKGEVVSMTRHWIEGSEWQEATGI